MINIDYDYYSFSILISQVWQHGANGSVVDWSNLRGLRVGKKYKKPFPSHLDSLIGKLIYTEILITTKLIQNKMEI